MSKKLYNNFCIKLRYVNENTPSEPRNDKENMSCN